MNDEPQQLTCYFCRKARRRMLKVRRCSWHSGTIAVCQDCYNYHCQNRDWQSIKLIEQEEKSENR